MTIPLSRFLSSFSDPAPPPADVRLPIDAPALRITREDLDSRLAEAQREVAARHEEEIASLKAAHEQALTDQLAAARAAWCEAEGPAFAARLNEAVTGLKTELSIDIAAALMPLLSEAVVVRAQAALCDVIDIVLKDAQHLTLRGRADLLDAIRVARPEAAGIEYVASDDADVVLNADECRIETKLGLALAALNPTKG